ncbi:MAG: PSD1 and planctomycete cytochrome C domain-containing protein [Planctomycetes bacterium]|nr:PSD1 and planctomycete cytochrome C domain-containing protein [Planctomycetota bacterium]
MRWIIAFAVALSTSASHAADAPDFNRDVRPILSARCFKCHGPDDAARKAKLRLDTREGAEATLGKVADSELVRRIFATDDKEVMPPPAVKHPLTAKEKDTLKAWVAAGAKYESHWAFAPVKRPIPWLHRDLKGSVNAIDAFVRGRLDKEGLTHSPEADRQTLIRRVYLDLIGIPPTPAEVDAFVNDKDADAYEKMVEKLLGSPQYGERWARKWLDLARYSDTNGYEKDRRRSVWPYRDWVIKSLNDDMPFDQFTIEQLAGDLLPNATLSQRTATGFHRNTMLNEEGGIDPLEFRYYAMVDRIATTGTTWLGLTTGCAQCHTHKFDPITHTEYFKLFAFLNNADEPELAVPTPEQAKKRAELQQRIEEMEAKLLDRLPHEQRTKLFDAWCAAEHKIATKWTVQRPTKLDGGPHTKLALTEDSSILATGDAMKQDRYTLTLTDLPAGTTAIRIEALPHDSLPAHGPGRAYYEGPKGDFLLGEITLTADDKPVKIVSATEAPARPNTPAMKALDGNSQTGWASGGNEGKASQAVFVLEKPLTAKAAKLELLFERHYAASLGHFRVSTTTAVNPKARDIPAEIERLLTFDGWGYKALVVLLEYWVTLAPELKAARDEIDALRKQLPQPATTLVMQERPADNPRQTFRHHRGEFLQPKEAVTPGVPSWLPPLPKDAPANRLTFAKWLVSPENPLTARVTVNRHWHAFFGRGLVRTLDDFGYQGEAPTHPELLDWLAAEFVERGWSVKKLHKLIVTSATYRQTSRMTPELLAKDADNKLLARGPRVRLEAEQIRDSALKAAGLLSSKMYGPSVFPPQPANATDTSYGNFQWKVSDGEDRYRRGLYTFAKRTAPYAMSGTFDAPSGEACVARREVTNSALQALTMLNDAVLLEASQALARRTMAQKGKPEACVTYLFRVCLVRTPTAEEVTRLAKFYEAQRARFAIDPERADAVAGMGSGPAAERAAWTATARAILNFDEFVTKE